MTNYSVPPHCTTATFGWAVLNGGEQSCKYLKGRRLLRGTRGCRVNWSGNDLGGDATVMSRQNKATAEWIKLNDLTTGAAERGHDANRQHDSARWLPRCGGHWKTVDMGEHSSGLPSTIRPRRRCAVRLAVMLLTVAANVAI